MKNKIETYLNYVDEPLRDKLLSLLEYLYKEFPDAPGSSGNHQAYPGGYYDHIAACMYNGVELYNIFIRDTDSDISLSDMMAVLFLHDIEKPVKYSPDKDKWPTSDGEIRSVLFETFYIILSSEIELGLRYIHGECDDYRKDKRVMTPLCALCHCADVISARVFPY